MFDIRRIVAQYDKERLSKPKRIEDVYSVIEEILDVPYGWQYITPDQSILGITAFNAGYIWVWPEAKYYDGLMPYQVEVEKGEIVIDATLTENDNRGRENFTVIHTACAYCGAYEPGQFCIDGGENHLYSESYNQSWGLCVYCGEPDIFIKAMGEEQRQKYIASLDTSK